MSSPCISVSTTARGTCTWHPAQIWLRTAATPLLPPGASRKGWLLMDENGRRNFDAQFCDPSGRLGVRRFVEFERLKFQKIFNEFFHGRWDVIFIHHG